MASEVKTNKVSPASGTNVTLGNSGDTVSLGSGATASGFLPSSISTSGDDFQFNSGYGSVATAYGCRAWVNFDGTGTVAIRESGNVSSITDNGTGTYVVNLSSALPDANGSACITVIPGTASSANSNRYTNGAVIATNQVRVNVLSLNPLNVFNDTEFVAVSVFR
jgi:hypothetical protein